ncbi:[protein-PII] uridylyltransferase [Aquihabitans sp. G128]|uniref:[protein-PII] uridylyltransferase n=1 Tax=Aquihabitans sp. G128 TaxID=2849779 RepID=UPI001C2104E3|nr:[protein-PII] uridylyltransferase [Aquihabitans sp. G128]QXC59123.1 [protein-PII] uridylyltransferase [Aquihabitans sp. G128]
MSLAADRDRIRNDASLHGMAFSDAWRAVIDAWLVELFATATADEGPDGLALVAVGGYGRGDLAPNSDLDLLLLHRKKAPPQAVAEKLWYPIWDEGLKLGHAVRTVGEAIELSATDLDTATSLLTVRHLAGDEGLTADLTAAATAQWRKKAKRYLGMLRTSVAARQDQFGEVAFLLEPDLKEGRGGLRDIHALRWAELARGVLEDGDAALLAEAEDVLFRARVELHRSANRPTERLTLQDQDPVAAALGTTADQLMLELSSAAAKVAWIADETWDRVGSSMSTGSSLLGWRSRDRAPGLLVREGQVQLESNADPASHPELVLSAAILATRKHARMSRATHARLAARAPLPPDPWPPELRAQFVELLAGGHDAIRVIEAMDQTGLWERFMPDWGPVRNRPQRNAYHRFTVDRHLLEATSNAAALVDRVDRPDLLLVGTLLHDIGKGRPGDHTEVGMDLIEVIGPRMGFDDDDTTVLVDMCRHHLLLPDVATRRDLSDETTISAVAEAVGDRLRLHLLAGLTEADSLATGPAAWGSWKAELVRELVRRVDHYLEGGDLAALATVEFPDAEHRALMAAGEVVVVGDGDTITVVAPDQRGLFSRVAGALALHGLEVRSADAAAEDGMAVEQFRVTSRFGSSVPWDRVTLQVRAALGQRLAIEARLADRISTYSSKNLGPRLPPPVVQFDDAASLTATVIEVHAPDRMGLLYRVTRAFAEFDIDVRVAKVQTLGDLVVDAFYVTHTDGTLVTDEVLRGELERALLHAVS